MLLAAPAGAIRDAISNVVREIAPQCSITPWTDPERPLPDAQAGQAPKLAVLTAQLYGDAIAEAVARLAAHWTDTPVVVVADDSDPSRIDALFAAGAAAFLPESYSPPMMAGVLKLALEGATYRPAPQRQKPSEATHAVGKPESSEERYSLTSRQKEVLGLVAQGKTNHAVATQLGIAEGTVKLHMNAIYKALNVANRSEAILVATRLPDLRKMQISQAESGTLDLEWLLPHMTHRRLPKGARIFNVGDPGEELYYLQRGTVRLPEINSKLGPGELFGEIGIFAPVHQRTSSAECDTDVDLFTLTAEQVKQIYYLNPHFAFYVVNLIAKRLMADRERAN